MKTEEKKEKVGLFIVIFTLLSVVLVGCYPSNMNWSSLKFWQSKKQGIAMDDRAVKHFMGQIRACPGNPDAHYSLASYYQERGRYKEAIEEYDKVIKIDPSHLKAYNAKGICHDQIGEHDRAIACFEKALTLDAHQDYIWNNLCYAYYLKGEYDNAVAACEKAVAINSGNIRIRNNLALVLAMSGRYDRAYKEFESVAGGDKAYAHFKMASIYHDKAMFAKAIEQYKEVLSIDPNSEKAKEGLTASTELLKIADAATKNTKEKVGISAEENTKQVNANDVIKIKSNLIDEIKATEENTIARKLYDEGRFLEAAKHFAKSHAYNPQLNSAVKGLDAAEALAKIEAAPSVKLTMNTEGVQQINKTGNKSIFSKSIGIEVSNGNGKRHMARDVGKYLRNKGFNVVRLSNADRFNYVIGNILYEKDYKNIAEEIAQRIPQLVSMQEVEKISRSNIKVKVLIGKDLVASRQQYKN